jgi:hypothetical protein
MFVVEKLIDSRAFTSFLPVFAFIGMISEGKTARTMLKNNGDYEDDPISGPKYAEKDEVLL